jgi:ribosomal protein S12 methylthiotransferase
VLVEQCADGAEPAIGRGAHQGPEVDGTTALIDTGADLRTGAVIRARVVATDGVDLVAQPQPALDSRR